MTLKTAAAASTAEHCLHVQGVDVQGRSAFLGCLTVLLRSHETCRPVAVQDGVKATTRVRPVRGRNVLALSVDEKAGCILSCGLIVLALAEEGISSILGSAGSNSLLLLPLQPRHGTSSQVPLASASRQNRCSSLSLGISLLQPQSPQVEREYGHGHPSDCVSDRILVEKLGSIRCRIQYGQIEKVAP